MGQFWMFLYPDGPERIDGLYSRVREEKMLGENYTNRMCGPTGGNLTARFSVVNKISC